VEGQVWFSDVRGLLDRAAGLSAGGVLKQGVGGQRGHVYAQQAMSMSASAGNGPCAAIFSHRGYTTLLDGLLAVSCYLSDIK
jgi:hypothetical protein